MKEIEGKTLNRVGSAAAAATALSTDFDGPSGEETDFIGFLRLIKQIVMAQFEQQNRKVESRSSGSPREYVCVFRSNRWLSVVGYMVAMCGQRKIGRTAKVRILGIVFRLARPPHTCEEFGRKRFAVHSGLGWIAEYYHNYCGFYCSFTVVTDDYFY